MGPCFEGPYSRARGAATGVVTGRCECPLRVGIVFPAKAPSPPGHNSASRFSSPLRQTPQPAWTGCPSVSQVALGEGGHFAEQANEFCELLVAEVDTPVIYGCRKRTLSHRVDRFTAGSAQNKNSAAIGRIH
jgi:hypothetical protein